jgi:1-acyl-sn-glycerol-3-phosphate acyltransferase
MTEKSLAYDHGSAVGYHHARYEPMRRFLRIVMRILVATIVKVDRIEGVENIPASGPLILYSNHIAFIDPILIIHAVPRNIVPLAKVETYDYPVVGIFPRLWNVISVQRGEVDRRALRACLQVLEAGEILWIAPEGTRRPALLGAKDGMAYLAVQTGAPLLPISVDGTRGLPALPFSRRWKEPGVSLLFGRPFRFKPGLGQNDRTELTKMTTEAMYILSGMLPPARRGVFSDLSQATQETIQWL